MFIDKITLKNFRNYENIDISFTSGINFFTGRNGSGKTNILEAIGVLSGIKSFRNSSDKDMVKWNEKSYYCSMICEDEDKKSHFEVGFGDFDNKNKKKVKIDGNEVKKFSDYYGEVLTVIFQPDDIDIINGGPELRRKYFDSLISKVDRKYLSFLTDFKKILLSRNKCLKDISEGNQNRANLSIWDELFAEKTEYICKKRQNFLEEYNLYFYEKYNSVSSEGKISVPEIKYSTDSLLDKNGIIEVLNNRKSYDIMRRTTTTGPQRDDFVLYSNGKVFTSVASQGQKRTASIALKNSEIAIIEQFTKKKVIILIDDIFSELDQLRKKNLIYSISRNNQILLTAVNIENVREYFNDKNIKHFEVNDNRIIVKDEMEI